MQTSFDNKDWLNARKLMLEQLSKIESNSIKATFYNNLGVASQELGLHNIALENYKTAESIASEHSFDLVKVAANYNLGYLHFVESRWDDAVFYLGKALEVANSLQDTQYKKLVHGLILDVESMRHHASTLLDEYTSHSNLTPLEQIERLRSASSVYVNAGAYIEAIDSLTEAVKLAKLEGLANLAAILLNDLAIVHKSTGLADSAKAFFEQALNQALTVEDDKVASTVYNNYGLLEKELGHYPEAIEALEKSLLLKRKLSLIEKTGDTLYNLASVYFSNGNKKLALDYATQALEIDRQHNPENEPDDQALLDNIQQMKD